MNRSNTYWIRCSAFIIIVIIYFFCGCSENIPPEKKALELVKGSRVINSETSVSRFIEEFINKKGDDVKAIGWDVEKMGEQKYIVSYKYKLFSFNEGIGKKGFFFEVDLSDESVVDKTNEYLEKLKPLSNAYSDENEIFKDIINEDDSLIDE